MTKLKDALDTKISSYQVWHKDYTDDVYVKTVVALSASDARYSMYLDWKDILPDIRYIDMRCKKYKQVLYVGKSTEFAKVAKQRGVEFTYPGMKVEVGGNKGVIVDSNSSANFDVLFTEGKNKGLTLNCHPRAEIKYFDESGAEIKYA